MRKICSLTTAILFSHYLLMPMQKLTAPNCFDDVLENMELRPAHMGWVITDAATWLFGCCNLSMVWFKHDGFATRSRWIFCRGFVHTIFTGFGGFAKWPEPHHRYMTVCVRLRTTGLGGSRYLRQAHSRCRIWNILQSGSILTLVSCG